MKPRLSLVPDYSSSLGAEAVDLAASAGLVLDDWEAFVLEHSLGRKKDGSWAAFEIGVCVPRQNGKGAILEARELAGLFLLGERYIIHSAHLIDTSLEAFRRLLYLIEETPELDKQVKRVSNTNGQEAIELKSGPRIRFRTRTKGGGRGFSCDCLILDEAMFLPEFSHGALLPTLSARSLEKPGPQVWYTGSAVDQLVHENGVVLSRVRERATRGKDPSLVYFEWSLDEDNPDVVDDELAADRKAWQTANPALGIRIAPEHVDKERRSLAPRTFAVERLNVGDWPPTSSRSTVIDLEKWAKLGDPDSIVEDPVVFGFDVRPDRSAGSIGVAGNRPDGLAHLEVIERRRGTDWIVPRLLELQERHGTSALVCDARGPASSLVHELEDEVTLASTQDLVDACSVFFDAVEQETLRHLGTPELLAAIRGAAKRPLGDSWAWSRKNSSVDISPLVACTLALWASQTGKQAEPFALAW